MLANDSHEVWSSLFPSPLEHRFWKTYRTNTAVYTLCFIPVKCRVSYLTCLQLKLPTGFSYISPKIRCCFKTDFTQQSILFLVRSEWVQSANNPNFSSSHKWNGYLANSSASFLWTKWWWVKTRCSHPSLIKTLTCRLLPTLSLEGGCIIFPCRLLKSWLLLESSSPLFVGKG